MELPISIPAGAPAWVTVELLLLTLRTWQPYYDIPLTVADALEILLHTTALIRIAATRDEPRSRNRRNSE